MAKKKTNTFLRRSEPGLRRKIALDAKLGPPIRVKIVRALRDGGFLSKAAAEEAAFHLTDWIAELHDVNRLFVSSRWNSDRAQGVLMAFVAHASHHLAAAHRTILGDPITDVFEIGAVKGSGRGSRKPGAPYPKMNGRAPRVKRKA